MPVSPLLSVERVNRYGSVPGLDDEELASPDELERQIIQEEFGPVLRLPVQGNGSGIRASVDEDGRVDWGAFGSADFDRMQPAFDKARYKADRIRGQVKDLVIMLDIINQRVKTPQKWKVIKYVRMGWMDVDDIQPFDLWQLAAVYLRIIRLKNEIAKLEEASHARRKRAAEAYWSRYD